MNNLESINHVTGKSVYLDDIPVVKKHSSCGGVYGSPVAHGRITQIDISRAESLPGVEEGFYT